jgi:hypothetical protein
MAHKNVKLDPSYWLYEPSQGRLENSETFLEDLVTDGYVFEPTSLNALGLTKDSYLTAEQFANFRSSFSTPHNKEGKEEKYFHLNNAERYLLSNWTSLGWGANKTEVLENYNNFIQKNLLDNDNNNVRMSINRGNLDLSSLIVNGVVSGSEQEYFVPILLFSDQADDLFSLNTGLENFVSTSSLSLQINQSFDDSFIELPDLPFDFYFLGTNYKNSIFLGSNTYLTFGQGSSNYSGLSASNPFLPKIHLGSADHSYQRVYWQQVVINGQDALVVRYEGTNSTGGTPGSPNIVMQITFFPNQRMTVTFGSHAGRFGQRGIASASSYVTTFTLDQNTSYAFSSDATGYNWVVEAGKYWS